MATTCRQGQGRGAFGSVGRRMGGTSWRSATVLAAAALLIPAALVAQNPSGLRGQSPADVARKSQGCLECHNGIEDMHLNKVPLGCIDCHGGNAQALSEKEAHVRPRHADRWPTAANPERSFTWLEDESSEFIRFVNPGDLRVAELSCGGSCHGREVAQVHKSLMATSALLWGGAAYNNGILSTKRYVLGESYTADGTPAIVQTVPPPTAAEASKKGVLPFLAPLPRWEISQPGDNFRAFERGGRVARGNPSEIGIPDPFEEPGRPDMKLGDRGFGTQLRISSPVLNLQKTRLNDPHLWFLGTNDQPGDYRSSGCTACHVVYANDRSPVHSGPYAQFGNRGRSATRDTTISKRESGHPIKHEFTSAIPSSQCMVCHMHQPNAFVNTYYGFQWWDYETDGAAFYPEKEVKLSTAEEFAALSRNPEEAVLRGRWRDPEFLAEVSRLNPQMRSTQFADYHGHGWIFRAVFKKDRKGNLLDRDGAIIPADSEHKFHGVVPDSAGSRYCDDACRAAPKAVHLKDIHAEKGMHCVDCHFGQDAHGTGKLVGEFHDAIEIQCIDCHGDATARATLRTSGVAAQEGGRTLTTLNTPFDQKRFVRRGKRITQRSMVDSTLQWDVPQVIDTIDSTSANYNPKAAAAKLIATGGQRWQPGMGMAALAHSNQKMECYTCHSAWVTNCFGCHLPQQANWKKRSNHFEGETSRNWTTYNPQVVRDDGFMLCVNATTKGNKVAPARSSSALVLSSRNANREQTYNQVAPISAPGYSSQAFNPHFPHTVRKTETRSCTDCHLSRANDNNAWMAQTLLQGTNLVNFMGQYAWVGMGEAGFEGVAITESREPQAVIGSTLHRLAYPDEWKRHRAEHLELQTAYHHGGTEIRSLQLRGDYLFTANGTDGFRVYDVANVANKGFSERVVSAPVSPLGQRTYIKTKYATAIALPTNMPIDTRRLYRPENQEQWPIHPLYSYAYITDRFEGLILVDVMPLVDRDPTNNFLQRAVTFNPDGKLAGATALTIAGNYVYVCCDAGLVVVSVADPLRPKIVATIGAPHVLRPRAIAVQFRYAFVCDTEGLKTIDVTFPERPEPVATGVVRLADARDVYVARTYAYVAGGAQGLVIVDVERPDRPIIDQVFTADGWIVDATSVRVASTNSSVFAYVADGEGGLKVIQLTSPDAGPEALGFSPRPAPRLIATRHTHGRAIALSKGMDRDRAVDESGNQVSVFGRLGSRPFTLEEQEKLYLRDGKLWFVTDGEEPQWDGSKAVTAGTQRRPKP